MIVLEATVPSPSANSPNVLPPLDTIGTLEPMPVKFKPTLPNPVLVIEVTELALVIGPMSVVVKLGSTTLRVSAPEFNPVVMLPLITIVELLAPVSLSNSSVLPSKIVGLAIVRV